MRPSPSAWIWTAWALASCVASHAAHDAAPPVDTSSDAPADTSSDASIDAVPPRPDSGECGTLAQPCEEDEDCSAGLTCIRDLFIDAGVAGLCIPPNRGFCGGLGGGEPCAVETDLCVAPRYMTDSAWCFEPTQFRCLCEWPIFAEGYDCEAHLRP